MALKAPKAILVRRAIEASKDHRVQQVKMGENLVLILKMLV